MASEDTPRPNSQGPSNSSDSSAFGLLTNSASGQSYFNPIRTIPVHQPAPRLPARVERIYSYSKEDDAEDGLSAVSGHRHGSMELTSFQLDLIGVLAWLPSDEDLLAAELEHTHITPTIHDVPERLQLPATGPRELCEGSNNFTVVEEMNKGTDDTKTAKKGGITRNQVQCPFADVTRQDFSAVCDDKLPATLSSSASSHSSHSPKERRITFAQSTKYSPVRERALQPPLGKKLSLLTGRKGPLHKGNDDKMVVTNKRMSLPSLSFVKNDLETPKSHTDYRPATPEAIGAQPPVRPPRPRSLFSERDDSQLVIGAQAPTQPTQTTTPASILPSSSQSQSSFSLSDDANPRPNSLPGIPRPTTPLDPSMESRWSPDSSPEKPSNPIKRIFGSLAQSTSRASSLRRMRSFRNKQETSLSSLVPVQAPIQTRTPSPEARLPGQPRKLRKRVSVMLEGMGGQAGDKSKNQDMAKDRRFWFAGRV